MDIYTCDLEAYIAVIKDHLEECECLAMNMREDLAEHHDAGNPEVSDDHLIEAEQLIADFHLSAATLDDNFTEERRGQSIAGEPLGILKRKQNVINRIRTTKQKGKKKKAA